MGKRHVRWSLATYLRYLREGRGKGDLEFYKPWLTTHDFPSMGKVVRILGKKTHRVHHLMSQLEKIFFLILDNDPNVQDIKEQYPLPLRHTQLIAAKLGIDHPVVNGFPYVMTTDLFYLSNGQWHAVQIKHSSEVNEPRVQEKFAIEKAYYSKIGVDWKVLTEEDLPRDLADNYFWLSAGESLETLIPDPAMREGMTSAFLELYLDNTLPFHDILTEMDLQSGVRPGTTMQIFKHLVANGRIELDLSSRINMEDPRQKLLLPA